MKKIFLGSNPVTSILGYLILGLTTAHELLKDGETNGWTIAIAVAFALLGRASSDSGKDKK